MPWNSNSLRWITKKEIKNVYPDFYNQKKRKWYDKLYGWLNSYDEQFYLRPIVVIVGFLIWTLINTFLPQILEVNNAIESINARIANIAVTISLVLTIAVLLTNQFTEKNEILTFLVFKDTRIYITLYISVSSIIFLGIVTMFDRYIEPQAVIPITIFTFISIFFLIIIIFGSITKVFKKGKSLNLFAEYLQFVSIAIIYERLLQNVSKEIFEKKFKKYYIEYGYKQENVTVLTKPENGKSIYDIKLNKLKDIFERKELKNTIFYYPYGILLGRKSTIWSTPLLYINREAKEKNKDIEKEILKAVIYKKERTKPVLKDILEKTKDKILECCVQKDYDSIEDALEKVKEIFIAYSKLNDPNSDHSLFSEIINEISYTVYDILETEIVVDNTKWDAYHKERLVLHFIEDIARLAINENKAYLLKNILNIINGYLSKHKIESNKNIEIAKRSIEIYSELLKVYIRRSKNDDIIHINVLRDFFHKRAIFNILLFNSKNNTLLQKLKKDNELEKLRERTADYKHKIYGLFKSDEEKFKAVTFQHPLEHTLYISTILTQAYILWEGFTNKKEEVIGNLASISLNSLSIELLLLYVSHIMLYENQGDILNFDRWGDSLYYKPHNSLTSEVSIRPVVTTEKIMLLLCVKAILDGGDIRENSVFTNNIDFFNRYGGIIERVSIYLVGENIEYTKQTLNIKDDRLVLEPLKKFKDFFNRIKNQGNLISEKELFEKEIPQSNSIISNLLKNAISHTQAIHIFNSSVCDENLEDIDFSMQVYKSAFYNEKKTGVLASQFNEKVIRAIDREIGKRIIEKTTNIHPWSKQYFLNEIKRIQNSIVVTSDISINKIKKEVELNDFAPDIKTGAPRYLFSTESSNKFIYVSDIAKRRRVLIYNKESIRIFYNLKEYEIGIKYYTDAQVKNQIQIWKQKEPNKYEEALREEIDFYYILNNVNLIFYNKIRIEIDTDNVTILEIPEGYRVE